MPAAITGSPSGTPRNNFSSDVGFRFAVGAADLYVTHLGRWKISGNTGTHTVKIVQVGGGNTALASVSIDMTLGTAGSYQYVALGSELTLSAGTSYRCVSTETSGGDHWHETQVLAFSSDIASIKSTYFDGGAYTDNIDNEAYVPTNFQYSLTPGGGGTVSPSIFQRRSILGGGIK